MSERAQVLGEQRQLPALRGPQLGEQSGEDRIEQRLERAIEAVEGFEVMAVVLEGEARIHEAHGALGPLMVGSGLRLQALQEGGLRVLVQGNPEDEARGRKMEPRLEQSVHHLPSGSRSLLLASELRIKGLDGLQNTLRALSFAPALTRVQQEQGASRLVSYSASRVASHTRGSN